MTIELLKSKLGKIKVDFENSETREKEYQEKVIKNDFFFFFFSLIFMNSLHLHFV